MRRLLENAALLVGVFAFLAVVKRGWERLPELSARLGTSENEVVDATIGWVPIGALLVVIGLLPLRRPGSLPLTKKVLYAVLLLPWGALAATYLWTPLAGDRGGWLDDVSAGGDAFRDGVVASQVALSASVALIVALAVAQIVSPRWQPGNATNERRSAVASSAFLAIPSVVALLVVWVF